MSGTVPPLAPVPVFAVGHLKPALARCFLWLTLYNVILMLVFRVRWPIKSDNKKSHT